MSYDDSNRKLSETVTNPTPGGNGTAVGYTYSSHGELQSATIPGEGCMTMLSLSTSKAEQFSYDAEVRLTQASVDTGGLLGGSTQTYTLDAVTNRTAHSTVTGDWVYDVNNRLLQRGSGPCGTVASCYSWDGTATPSLANLVARYGYDPMHRRIWKEHYRDPAGQPLAQAKRTLYLYADEGLIAESTQSITLNADGSVTANTAPAITTQYGPRPDSPFGTGTLFIKTQNSNGQATLAYYHHDHLNTPIQATDKAGNVVWAASYDPFGQASIITPVATPSIPTITSNLRLPGQYWDAESGLHYNWHRYYEPQTGRYMQSDPIGLRGGPNPYFYAEANPLMFTDPLGLWAWGDPIDQGVVDAVTGFGDAFLIPELVRDALDIDGGVNQCSASYRGGKANGFVVGAVPFGLALGAELGATKFASILNKNRYFRIGPGKASAGARFGLGGGRNVPMARIGNGKPSDWNHIDLRSRLPKVAPLGGPGECGCP